MLREGDPVPVEPIHLAEAADLLGDGEVGSTVAKQLVGRAVQNGESPMAVAKAEGLFRIRDEEQLTALAEEATAADPRSVADFLKGKTAAKKRLLGWIIRQTGGRADPAVTETVLDRVLTAMQKEE